MTSFFEEIWSDLLRTCIWHIIKPFQLSKINVQFGSRRYHSPFSTMVRSSISNTIPKSQAPLLKAPSGPSGDELNFLVSKRARQAFLSFAFLFFQASGDNNTKPFSQSQEGALKGSVCLPLTDYALKFTTLPSSVSSLRGLWNLTLNKINFAQ